MITPNNTTISFPEPLPPSGWGAGKPDPMLQDIYWREVVHYLHRHMPWDAPCLASPLFGFYFPGVMPLSLLRAEDLDRVDWIAFDKDLIERTGIEVLEKIRRDFVPVLANDVFVIFHRQKTPPLLPGKSSARKRWRLWWRNFTLRRVKINHAHVDSLWNDIAARTTTQIKRPMEETTAIVVSTYNRPHALERSLPRILALGCPVMVIDDGSAPQHAERYEQLRQRLACGRLHWHRLPVNRGLACALNAGLAYVFADPAVEWISYLQDDVDVHPDLLRELAKVQEHDEHALWSGRVSPAFPQLGSEMIQGEKVAKQWSTSGQHLHASRAYWESIYPIPSRAVGAPLKGMASDVDLWVGSAAPRSAGARLLPVYCLTGLAHQFLHRAEDSTWHFGVAEDPPLRS